MAESLSDKIATLLSAAPTSFDPEDDVNEETTARVESQYASDDDNNLSQNLSQFRKQNVELLEEVDKRYEGKRASRKKLTQYDEWESKSEDGKSSEETEDSGDEESAGEESDATEEYDDEVYGEDSGTANIFKNAETVSTNKSTCVRQQLNTWESFLEMRIQLQKCLIVANKLPQGANFEQLKNDADFDVESRKAVGTVKNLLDKLLELQMLLLKNYPETKKLFLKPEVKNKSESDEEIPSDTDEEELSEVPCRKRMKTDEYSAELTNRSDLYYNYRNSVLQKWHDKTQIGVNKSGNVVHSVTEQIKHILTSKEKLIKATQLKRTDYDILGEHSDKIAESSVDVYNTNIFDDTDFYHHLLRELIEFKSSDLTDPVKLGRQWMQLQSLRSKMKKKVDTKATKGRKIRYVVHSKLVNFMAPVEDLTWQESAKNELYGSLFGKNQSGSKISS
ncbi:hypothetical protein PPYR_00946 [Photinus pyralis]|uniref:Protein AATF n=1 Tax=Photinus pyralis TaxID=7054 RepID=A0A1Y1MNX3_PHOPY|nr:protein AATF [Photinus pyralis]KAB0803976.1 hypothetical protein PPYR_00946 [Photinus pyralis]